MKIVDDILIEAYSKQKLIGHLYTSQKKAWAYNAVLFLYNFTAGSDLLLWPLRLYLTHVDKQNPPSGLASLKLIDVV